MPAMPRARRGGGHDGTALRLEAAGQVDVAPLLPVEVSSLPRGLHARCIAFHPTKPLLTVGAQACVGGYDLVSGVRMGRVDVRSAPVALAFSRDGSLLVVATQEWHILGINTATWRMRVLAPFNEARSAPMDHVLLAITGGQRPVVFFTRIGKNSVRMAVNPGPGAEKKSADRKLKWGVKLKLDVNKPVVGLAAHPSASQLLVAFDDGSLRGYALGGSGLAPLWPASYMLPGDAAALGRVSLGANPLQALAHPFTDGAALLAIGLGSPHLLLLELVARQEPRVLLKTAMPGGLPVVGLGLQQGSKLLFAFSTTSTGRLRVLAWQMRLEPTGLTFDPLPVEVADAEDAELSGASAGPLPPASDWQALWGVDSYRGVLQNPAASSFLLDKLLAPVVQSAVLHPLLGCVAVQRVPPLALRQAANIMQQRLGLISAPEAAISRRTASVPLLRLLHPGLAGSGWPGGRVAPLHTDLTFWQPAAGLGAAKLQFPCHLYFLSPHKLSKYALASKTAGCFVALPGVDAAGVAHEAVQLVHSPRQHAWLVFFQPKAAAGGAAASGAGGHFTLVHGAEAGGQQASWFLPGRTGVFLGPQDLYFAVLGGGDGSSGVAGSDSTLAIYRTPGFTGKSHPLYTISLAKPPSALGCSLFAGPAALAVPRVGAEAAAKAAQEAAEAADKAAEQAAAAAAEGGEAAAEGADGAAAAAVAAAAAAPPPPAAGKRPRIRRPGETWRPDDAESEESDDGGGMLVPVLGIGSAFQGPTGRGLGARDKAAASARQRRQQHGGFGFDDAPTHEDEHDDQPGDAHSGGGVVLWLAAGNRLVMGGLPAPGVQYAAGEDSDDPDAADATASAAAAPDMGTVVVEHSLQLQPHEQVVSVAWQNTSQGATPLEPWQCAAAILTTQRLLLVSGDLAVLASTDASCGSVGLASGITSLLWVGPALLFMTAAGQVMQLTWTGQVQHVASVSSQPPPLLAGALADSLLLVRQSLATGEPEVTSRAVGILQPLVLGWTSLASSGLLPKGLNTARAALQALLEAFDATHVASGMLWALIQGWCGDVAAALAAHANDVEPSVQLAANAAAGKWAAVVSSLRAEHERSVFYPAPAPQGSLLHHKLLAAAAGAVMHGQVSEAQACLEAAGEWEMALALAVSAGDFATLRSLSAGLQAGTAAAVAGGDQAAAGIARLARGLVAAYERGGRSFAPRGAAAHQQLLLGPGGGGGGGDWTLRQLMADDSFCSNAADWSFGGPGKLPVMETSPFNAPAAFIQDGDVGPLPRADDSTLGAYLGTADLTAQQADAGAGEPGAAPPGGVALGALPRASSTEQEFLASLDQLVALSSRAGDAGAKGGAPGMRRSSSAASSVDSEFAAGGGDGGAGPGAGAGTAPGAGGQRDPFAFSDDEDDDASFGYKFKITIKSKEDGANPAAAGATGASAADLKTAASKLKLGPPGASGSFKEAFGKAGSARQDSLRSSLEEPQGAASGIDALYDLSFIGKPPGGGTSSGGGGAGTSAAAAAAAPRPPRGPGGSSSSGGRAGRPEPPRDSFGALGELTGIASASGGLGGPPMRPKPKQEAAPVISDDDFFAALAPAMPADAKQGKLLAAPPPPSAGARAGPAAGPGAAFDDDFFTGGGLLGGPASSKAAPPPVPAPRAAAAVAGARRPVPLAPPPPAGGASPAPASAPPAAAGPTGGDSTALYLRGVGEMQAAQWDAAAGSFAATLTALSAEPPGDSRSQRQAFAAQYLAAVLLLKAAGAAVDARGARLYRYLCGLKLDDHHMLPLVKESIIRNKHVRNFRYAGDQLTWLVTRSLGSAPEEVMAKLQEDIDECDRQGGANAAISGDENVADWASLVAAGQSRADVEEVVVPLLQQP